MLQKQIYNNSPLYSSSDIFEDRHVTLVYNM